MLGNRVGEILVAGQAVDQERAGGSEAAVDDVELPEAGGSGLDSRSSEGRVRVQVKRVDLEAELWIGLAIGRGSSAATGGRISNLERFRKSSTEP